MKRSVKIIACGIFIIATILLCYKDMNSIYEKKLIFNSPEEIIEVLNSNVLMGQDKDFRYVNSNAFLECLSKRKRITDSSINFLSLKLKYDENINTDSHKESLVNKYFSLCEQNLKGYERPLKVQGATYRFKGKYTQGDDSGYMDIIFIDEGEGWVIDYFLIKYYEEGGEESVTG